MQHAHSNNEADSDIGKRIRRAFIVPSSGKETLYEGPNDTAIRTPFGIARDADLSEDEVRTYIEQHPDEISPFGLLLGGRPLYFLSPDAWKSVLRDRLATQPKDKATYTLDLIADHELRDMLPPEGRNPKEVDMFWRDAGDYGRVWSDVGWKVAKVDPATGEITFARITHQGLQQLRGPNGEPRRVPPLRFPGLDRQ